MHVYIYQFSSVQSLSHVQLFATPWITAHQASLSIINSRRLLKLMSIESVRPSSHLILCRPLLLHIRVYIYMDSLPSEHLHICIYIWILYCLSYMGFPGSSDGKESTFNARDLGSIPGPGSIYIWKSDYTESLKHTASEKSLKIITLSYNNSFIAVAFLICKY